MKPRTRPSTRSKEKYLSGGFRSSQQSRTLSYIFQDSGGSKRRSSTRSTTRTNPVAVALSSLNPPIRQLALCGHQITRLMAEGSTSSLACCARRSTRMERNQLKNYPRKILQYSTATWSPFPMSSKGSAQRATS